MKNARKFLNLANQREKTKKQKKLNIMGQCISISRYTYIGKYSYISEIGLDYWGFSFFF